ncbi:MAG: AAA family ATPase [Actinomycetota bacterium]|nr:AAA family ATPase [Actinomycetota bacterium]
MAKAQWCGGYGAAQLVLDRCLRRDGSLFSESTDREVWTFDRAAELDGRVGAPDTSKGNFIEKLDGQLDGLDRDAIQLAAELFYVELLGEGDTGGEKKEEHVNYVLGLVDGTTPIPEDLLEALYARGVATFGAGKNFRDAFMRFLVQFLIAWKSRDPADQERLARSPWDVLDLVNGIRTSTDALQGNALLHLLFPETFEYMISPSHRDRLVETFAAVRGVADVEGQDRQIQVIRKVASATLGREVELYEEPFHGIWRAPPSAEWRELLTWARRLYGRSDFDEEERDYKLRLADKLAGARAAAAADDGSWLELMAGAFKNHENNLTNFHAHGRFLEWCDGHAVDARAIISRLWEAGDDPQAAVADFLEALPSEAVSGPGTRLTLATFLLLGSNATGAPFFKTTVHRRFWRLLDRTHRASIEIDQDTVYRPNDLAGALGVDSPAVRRFLRDRYPREAEERGEGWVLDAEQAQAVVEQFGETADSSQALANFASWVQALEELRLRLLAEGLELRDLLDAQGIAYWLAQGPVPKDWSEEDKAAFTLFRKGPEAERDEPSPKPTGRIALPPVTAEVAAETHLPVGWLQERLDLLTEKRQVIFYGPPGAGKTFVALRLGEHVAAQGGQTRLVQFHPSYTYEDFFEGYRPVDSDDGQVKFKLVPGPLREMAKEARQHPEQPFVLIIDELNRGNVAKVFGELYFLLEYRGRQIQLQYSRDELFELPENLFVIGTMNTADRSIALVDSALRRRFYFAGFLPREEPVKSVLSNWLEANNLQPEPATLLESLNEAIGGQDFSVGPSYFMTADGTAPDVDRVWEHAIKPLLEEHFYGTERDIESEFSPKALAKRIAEAADATPVVDEAASDADDA